MIEIRIREAQKHVDPVDPDPEHWHKERVLYIFCWGGAGGRIRIRNTATKYCSGSIHFDVDADPCICLVDPDPAIFVIDLQDANKKLI